jgi:hypothetical protein
MITILLSGKSVKNWDGFLLSSMFLFLSSISFYLIAPTLEDAQQRWAIGNYEQESWDIIYNDVKMRLNVIFSMGIFFFVLAISMLILIFILT